MPPLLDYEGQGPGGASRPLSHEGGQGALPVENTKTNQTFSFKNYQPTSTHTGYTKTFLCSVKFYKYVHLFSSLI